MSRLYDGCLRVADWWLARSRVELLAAGAVLVLIVVSINQFVLRDFPNSGDEYVYLYQAQTLSHGRVWNDPPNEPQSFAFNYIVYSGKRAFGSFPVGWPLVLAGASWVVLMRSLKARLEC